MRLTKDEIRVLAIAFADAKYELYDRDIEGWNSALNDLEKRLCAECKDGRRKGRKSMNAYYDLQKRFAKKHNKGGVK